MKAVLVFDAIGLGLFTVVGTVTGFAAGLGIAQASAGGVITGVGGGLLRDIVAREVPVLVRPESELYAVPELVGAVGWRPPRAWRRDATPRLIGQRHPPGCTDLLDNEFRIARGAEVHRCLVRPKT